MKSGLYPETTYSTVEFLWCYCRHQIMRIPDYMTPDAALSTPVVRLGADSWEDTDAPCHFLDRTQIIKFLHTAIIDNRKLNQT